MDGIAEICAQGKKEGEGESCFARGCVGWMLRERREEERGRNDTWTWREKVSLSSPYLIWLLWTDLHCHLLLLRLFREEEMAFSSELKRERDGRGRVACLPFSQNGAFLNGLLLLLWHPSMAIGK